MEVMEEGNLLDRVQILLQRDLEYYRTHQTVLQETLCSGVVGGLLDFPRYASFAAVKLVMWWEEQFTGIFRKPSGLIGSARVSSELSEEMDRGCGGVVTNAAPTEFVRMVKETASQLLEHLHVLSQEALDHADLTVLTATLGAAALVKNCLWCYNDHVSKEKGGLTLHGSYKEYQEMSEALAERLLDLHCRLLSLYVLQDADSLCWDHPQPFFEGERGSFVVQMWWLYMQGTRRDLWSSVPPKTAQRVLSGMLNESLTILASRYNQAEPSPARAQLLITDIGNVLMCVNELLPSISNDAAELLGEGGSKILRDIHAKCHQLLICLTLRGASLATLFKVFRHGLDSVPAFEELEGSFAPWMILVAPDLQLSTVERLCDLPDDCAIFLELKVLIAQPQPSYPLLLKVLSMKDYKITTLLLRKMIPIMIKEDRQNTKHVTDDANANCKGFLCSGGGDCTATIEGANDAVHALVVTLTSITSVENLSWLLIPLLELVGPGWAQCLDRHQVWNLNRPAWLTALLAPMEVSLKPLVVTLLKASATGSSVPDLVGLTLAGLVRLADILPTQVFRTAAVLQEFIPADVKPLGKSVLLQMLVSVVYTLLVKSNNDKATALSEALCHLRAPSKVIGQLEDVAEMYLEHDEPNLESDVVVSRLLFSDTGRLALKAAHQCLVNQEEWLVRSLMTATRWSKPPNLLLHSMFHIGTKPFDQILSGAWKPDYQAVLERPLSLSKDTAWLHLSRRAEFRTDGGIISKHDKAVVDNLTAIFLTETSP